MKALVRRKGETILENSDLKFIDWKTGSPLTDSNWCGGPYILVQDYVPENTGEDSVPTVATPLDPDDAQYIREVVSAVCRDLKLKNYDNKEGSRRA